MKVLVTLDIDWASEYVIQYTVEKLKELEIPFTIFSTHNSPYLRSIIDDIEIGLHPFFHPSSSHGKTPEETLNNIFKIPYNIDAFRCHRFIRSNEISEMMKSKGMKCESNVCTNLETIRPFENRNGLLEIPVFCEDGSYLLNEHSFDFQSNSVNKFLTCRDNDELKSIIIHPMHFVVNTPNWKYMKQIKKKMTREQWNSFDANKLNEVRYEEEGISTFILKILNVYKKRGYEFVTIGSEMNQRFKKVKT